MHTCTYKFELGGIENRKTGLNRANKSVGVSTFGAVMSINIYSKPRIKVFGENLFAYNFYTFDVVPSPDSMRRRFGRRVHIGPDNEFAKL